MFWFTIRCCSIWFINRCYVIEKQSDKYQQYILCPCNHASKRWWVKNGSFSNRKSNNQLLSQPENKCNLTYQDAIPNFEGITNGKPEKSVNQDTIPNFERTTHSKPEKSVRNRRERSGCVILAGKLFLRSISKWNKIFRIYKNWGDCSKHLESPCWTWHWHKETITMTIPLHYFLTPDTCA